MPERTYGRRIIDTPSLREKFLLHQATVMFVDVSKRYPASVVAQGAAIAQRCLASYQNPLALQAALLGNRDRLRKLVRAADGAHKKSNNENAIKTVVLVDTVIPVILNDFNWAADMMILDHNQLSDLIALRPKGLGSDEERKKYRLKAYKLIQERRGQQGLPTELVTQLNPDTGDYLITPQLAQSIS